MRSWFVIDGALPPIDYHGDASFRYPKQLVKSMIQEYTETGQHVLDPFCGFGTTLEVCREMGRPAVGFEKDRQRYEYAQRFGSPPNQLIHDSAENIAAYTLPEFDFVICSPPFRSFRHESSIIDASYYAELYSIFKALRPSLRFGARIVVESVNLVVDGSETVPRAFCSMLTLSKLFLFEREYVCCTTGVGQIVPGYEHTYLLVFRNIP